MVSAWLAYASNPSMTKWKNAESVFTEPLNKSEFALAMRYYHFHYACVTRILSTGFYTVPPEESNIAVKWKNRNNYRRISSQ